MSSLTGAEVSAAFERPKLVSGGPGCALRVYRQAGMDLDSVLQEVHRSNMSKLGSAGVPLTRSDGKVLKSEHYFPPDTEAVLSRQGPLSLA